MEDLAPQRPAVRAAAVAGAFGLFLAFFCALFAPFPLHGALPGNTDTWFAIALSNTYRAELAALPGDAPASLYPARHPILYGESSPGVALAFVGLRGAGLDDVNAYYALLCLLFAGTATGLFMLARTLRLSPGAAVLAAVGFCCANFTLANIDDCVIVFFGLAALAAGWMVRYLETPERAVPLYAAAAAAGLQVYFSAYVFLLLALWLGVLVLCRGRTTWRAWRAAPRLPATAAALYLGLAAPFFLVYADTMRGGGFVTVRFFDVLVSSVGSLDPGDLFRALPDNLLYPAGKPHLEAESAALGERLYDADALRERVSDPEFALLVGTPAPAGDESYWVSTRRRAHLGYLIYALAAAGALAPWRWRVACLSLWALGLLLALGPMVTVLGRSFPTPLFPLYEHFEPVRLFRVPLRGYFLCVVALGLLAARGTDRLIAAVGRDRPRWARWLPWALCALFVVENVPFPLQRFEGRALAEPPAALQKRLGRESGAAVLLHLPSRIGLGYAGAADDLFELNREIVYMNWQTYLGQPTMNGVNGYLPRTRVEVQRWIERLPEDAALDALLEMCDGVPLWIVFHERMLLAGEKSVLAGLRESPRLRAAWSEDGDHAFEVHP